MDGLDIEIEGDSEAAVALALLQIVMRAEGKTDGRMTGDWVLQTYARCLAVVLGEEPEAVDSEDDEAVGDDDEDEEDQEAAEE